MLITYTNPNVDPALASWVEVTEVVGSCLDTFVPHYYGDVHFVKISAHTVVGYCSFLVLAASFGCSAGPPSRHLRS